MTLKKQAIRSVKITAISSLVVMLCQFTQISIFAHFLSPKIIGLMAIINLVIMFANAFMDIGISNAIIQKKNVTENQLSSLYWINIFSGLTLCLIIILLAPLVANFYGEQSLLHPLMWLSSVFIIIATGNQFRVLFQKNLEFTYIAWVEIIAAISSVGIAYLCVRANLGVYSIVGAIIVRSFVTSLFFFILGIKRLHVPKLYLNFNEVSSFLGFGLFQVGEKAVNYISANADKFLIGKFLGMSELGFYNNAWQMSIFPVTKINPIINRVAFPVYSKSQDDTQKLNSYYLTTQNVLSLTNIPLLMFLFFYSSDIVSFVFGSGWTRTADIIFYLAWIGVLKAISNPGGAIILAKGRADIGFYWNLIWAIIVISGLLISLGFGASLETTVSILLILTFITTAIWHIIVKTIGQINYRPISICWIKTIVISLTIAFASTHVVSQIGVDKSIYRILIGVTFCLLCYLPYIYFFEKKTFMKLRNNG